MRRPSLFLTLLLVVAALAGCAEQPIDDGFSGTPAATSPAGGTPASTPAATPPGGGAPAGDGECVSTDGAQRAATPIWILETSMGTMRLVLFCDKTPITAQNVVKLTESGYFDGTKFHRVIEGFMNQGGDPLTKDDTQASRWGTGGPGYSIEDEFYCADGTVDKVMNNPQYPGRPQRPGGAHTACGGELGLRHDTAGALSMANAGAGTGGSQFFITAAPQPGLDGAHPVFGHTADAASLDVALAINRAPTTSADRPNPPITITRATIEWG